MLDNNLATMGDLIASDGYLNTSVQFVTTEHEGQHRDPQIQYTNLNFGNT
jgi:hypothetical protein